MSMQIAIDSEAETAVFESAKVAPEAGEVVSIRPPKRWMAIDLRELWRFRELVFFLTWRDVKVRYKQTALGAAWAVLQPLMWMIVFTVFLGRLAKVPAGVLPYPVFVYLGVLPWTFFSTSVSSAGQSVVGSERLITKVYFPRLAIPMAAVGAAILDFLIAFGMLLVLMLWYGIAPSWQIVMAPVFFGLILLLALGMGTLLAALNVTYRDFRYVIPFLMQVWMFATPTVYMQPDAAAGGRAHAWLAANPMTWLVAAFRAACAGGAIPWKEVGMSAAFALVILIAGALYFRRTEQAFADTI